MMVFSGVRNNMLSNAQLSSCMFKKEKALSVAVTVDYFHWASRRCGSGFHCLIPIRVILINFGPLAQSEVSLNYLCCLDQFKVEFVGLQLEIIELCEGSCLYLTLKMQLL